MDSDDVDGEPLAAISDGLRRDYPDLEATLTTSGGAVLLARIGGAAVSLSVAAFLFLDPVVGIMSFYLCCILVAVGGTEAFIRGGQLRQLHRQRRSRNR